MACSHCNVAFHAHCDKHDIHRKVMISKTCTSWGCSMGCIGKNIASCSKNPQFLPVTCAMCARCACCMRAVHTRPLGISVHWAL